MLPTHCPLANCRTVVEFPHVLFLVLCILRLIMYIFHRIGLVWNLCVMYGGRRWLGLPTSRARARMRRLTPTDRYPRDSNPGPLDPKSSILPLSHQPPSFHMERPRYKLPENLSLREELSQRVINPRLRPAKADDLADIFGTAGKSSGTCKVLRGGCCRAMEALMAWWSFQLLKFNESGLNIKGVF